MNELQIKITADVKDIQSALTRVKKTLKEFEDSMASSSDVANGKLERQKGIIEQLNAKVNQYKTSITRALSEQEIAKYNAKLQDTQKDLARLNALGKVFEEKNVKVKEQTGLIGNLNAQLKRLKVSLQQATSEKEVARLNAELAQTSAELRRINSLGKNITAPAVKSFTQLKSSVGAANGSAIAFNRIIQDAPFGLLGVGNNIQQFTEQLAFLKQTTGSTGNALKSFFGSLFTSTNLLILGVSAVTAALTAYQMGVFDTKEETKEVVSETDRFNEALNNVIKSLNDVDSARLKANKSAAAESSEVELLNSVLTDNSKSENERIIVYNKLLERYPKIIGNITKEKALTEGLGDAYNVLIASIKERAALDAISESFSEAEKERIDLIVKERKETLLQNKLYEERDKLRKEEIDLSEIVNRNTARGNIQETEVTKKLREKRAAIASVNDQISILGNVTMPATNAALEENSGTLTILNEQYGGLDQALANLSDKDKPVKNLVRTFEDLSALNVDMILDRARLERLDEFSKGAEATFSSITSGAADTSKVFGKSLKEIKLQLIDFEHALNQVGLTSAQVFQAIALGSAEGFSSLNEFIMKLAGTQQFYFEASKIIEEGIEGTLGDVGFAISRALGEGTNALEAGGAALLNGIARILNDLGQLAIGTGITIAAIKEALKSLNPVVAIAAGVALIGLAGFVSAQANKLSGGFAGGGGGGPSAGQGTTFGNRREFGGPVSKGRAYIVGEKRPELFVPNTNGIIVPQLPSMDYSGASMSAGAMAVDVNIRGVSYGDDILFTVQQAEIRRGLR
jgi:hypothetical protein